MIIKVVLEFLSDPYLNSFLEASRVLLKAKTRKLKEKIKECGIIQKLYVTIVD